MIQRFLLSWVVFSLGFLGLGFAYAKSAERDLFITLEKYRTSSGTELQVEKKLTMELLGRERIYQGVIQLHRGRLRWKTTEPEASLLVFDGQTLWNEQPHPLGEGPVQVTKTSLGEAASQRIILAALLGQQPFARAFRIGSVEELSSLRRFHLETIEENPDFSDVRITIKPSEHLIESLSYQDELGNRTKLSFVRTAFDQKYNDDTFRYTPPAGSEITEM